MIVYASLWLRYLFKILLEVFFHINFIPFTKLYILEIMFNVIDTFGNF